MNDAARQFEFVEIGQLRLAALNDAQQLFARQHTVVVMDLQRTNTRREVDDAGELLRFEPLHQCMRSQAKTEIEYGIAELNQQIFIAGSTTDRAFRGMDHRRVDRCRLR